MEVKRYRRKISIEAVEWDGSFCCFQEIIRYFQDLVAITTYKKMQFHSWSIVDSYGEETEVMKGDYIVYYKGNFAVYENDTFNKEYEEIKGKDENI